LFASIVRSSSCLRRPFLSFPLPVPQSLSSKIEIPQGESARDLNRLRSAMTVNPTALAKQNPYYAKNHLGKVMCQLCNCECRDEANFLLHLEAKRHLLNLKELERAKERALAEQAEREQARLAIEELQHVENQKRLAALGKTAGTLNSDISDFEVAPRSLQGGTIGLPPPRMNTKKPEISFRTEPLPHLRQCKVWFDVHFRECDENTRPLHRWMAAREQTVEIADDNIKYLLFACEGYGTVAYTFPNVPHTDKDNADPTKFHCQWDASQKRYSLFFVLG
jgi:hypothetical protein